MINSLLQNQLKLFDFNRIKEREKNIPQTQSNPCTVCCMKVEDSSSETASNRRWF